ncbi:hypothetical protein [Burkholderia sp. WP9]|jgi:hypothetical protein|uniref:hypothetical protein n=1 Tax=Burkholderia sp. WP9 TaxID=1500263 RepID=UPI00115FDB6F|nr:hypothetical protein [Burkholderia sp. WP9]
MNARFFIGILIGFRPLSDLFDASFCPVPVRPGGVPPPLRHRLSRASRALCATSHRSFSVAGLMRRAVARAAADNARYAVRHIQSARPC